MEIHNSIIIDSWNGKISGVTITCTDKHVYMIFHVINYSSPPQKKKLKKKIKVSFSKLSLYHTTLGSKELKTAVFPELIF